MLDTKDADAISIVQITDTHIYADDESEFSGYQTDKSLQQVLNLAQTSELWPPDIMLATGDIVQDPEAKSYQRFYNIANPVTVPIFCLPGNHDEPELLDKYLNCEYLSSEKVVEFKHWTILLLNSFKPKTHAGELSEAELAWLEESLHAHKDKHIFIALHHHAVSIHSPWMDGMMLINHDAFLSIIKQHTQVKAVICGHIHQAFHEIHAGIHFIGSPSTCAQFKPGATQYEADALMPGFRHLTLMADGSINTDIYRID